MVTIIHPPKKSAAPSLISCFSSSGTVLPRKTKIPAVDSRRRPNRAQSRAFRVTTASLSSGVQARKPQLSTVRTTKSVRRTTSVPSAGRPG
ncbi:hypothetical protein ACQI4E_10095 [Streptomyces sp. CA-252508]